MQFWCQDSQIFWEIRSYIFICFYIRDMFPESHGFVAMLAIRCIKDTCSNLSLSNQWRETKLFDLVTGTATKPWLSGNMIPNMKKMWKWMFEFLRKFENRGIKSVWVSSILIKNSINLQLFTLILDGVGGPFLWWHL